ncbi:LOW QUALITY PROTEIN: Fructose-bisphosphate aldolase [Rhodotorula toruloides]|nr:LOW QUALITY PROTEIN: Fructose-bisphosphate aldolase [Rhodotorula toruloides]
MGNASSSEEDTKKPLPPPVPAVKKGRFADEDADDDVKDDWDVSDEEDKPKPQVVVGSLRNKGATKQKIAQKEAEERKKAEEAERLARENDPAALRAKARAAQLRSDMDSAASLFGEASLNDNPLEMNCRTKEDFSALAVALSDSLIQKHAGSKLFGNFVDELARLLAAPLKSDEVGKVRASMANLAMDKQKLEKAGTKGSAPGGKPPARMVARGREDLSSFGEVLDDDVAAAQFDEDEDFTRLLPASPASTFFLLQPHFRLVPSRFRLTAVVYSINGRHSDFRLHCLPPAARTMASQSKRKSGLGWMTLAPRTSPPPRHTPPGFSRVSLARNYARRAGNTLAGSGNSMLTFGVLTGKNLVKLMDYARENHFAIPVLLANGRRALAVERLTSRGSVADEMDEIKLTPPFSTPLFPLLQAFNCTSSSTVVAALEAARDSKSPVIIQVSQGGAAFFAGKGVANDKQQASIAGAVAAAHYVRSIAPTYGVPVVLHSDHCAKKLLQWFDGMLEADEAYYKEKGEPLFSSHMLDLSEESKEENIETCVKYFERMAKIDLWLEMEIGITGGEEDGVDNTSVDNNSLYTQPEDILDIHNALSKISPMFSIAAGFGNVHGVYKPGNWAYMIGFRDYFKSKAAYLETQVGNPEGADKPNKKQYDPRVWVREGEKTMKERCQVAFKDLRSEGTL